ncbi:MAG: hypothetical protein RLZZ568_1217 [Cyanobacteriota bacterium]
MLNSDRLIVPLDVPDLPTAIALVEQLPMVSFWKVGLELFVSAGPTIVDELKQRQKKVFLDLKFHDIPNTVLGACRSASQYGVDLLTLHSTAGRNALTMAAQAMQALDKPPQLLAITLLTSISSRELAFDLHLPLELPEYVLKMALLAQECGLNGAVCSPLEAAQLRQGCGTDFLLVCPGVRPTWASLGDQQRVMTPRQAIAAGADYLVIGRPLTAAPNPALAWEKLCQELDDV